LFTLLGSFGSRSGNTLEELFTGCVDVTFVLLEDTLDFFLADGGEQLGQNIVS
jgi:hypothetical protein